MSDQPNGEIVNPLASFPALTIRYDPDTQRIAGLEFKGGADGDFKTFEFVIAVLGMAQEFAKGLLMQAKAAQMQQQMEGAMIAENLRRGPQMRPR